MRSGLARAAHWVWTGSGPAAAALRALLLLPAIPYRLAVIARNAAYDAGWLPQRPLPVPSLGVGNLAVGGAGKTPVARYLAAELARRGRRVGVLLRGYGDDEVAEHRESLPAAIVVSDPDRHRGAREAVRRGAEVLVLDDCLQRRDVRTDAMVAVVAAETFESVRWPLPAGPWREGLSALSRADAVVVSRKSAAGDSASRIAASLAVRTRGGQGLVARLVPGHLAPLHGGPCRPPSEVVGGKRVVALCAIGAPEAFATQLRELGATDVDLVAHGDHHPYGRADVRAARRRAGSGGLVVTTGKDAVKLRELWPQDPPACWVAGLQVSIEEGGDILTRMLDRLAEAPRPRGLYA